MIKNTRYYLSKEETVASMSGTFFPRKSIEIRHYVVCKQIFAIEFEGNGLNTNCEADRKS